MNEKMLAKNRDLINILSNQRHDFQNHLQVIMGLIQLGRTDNAIAYIKEVTGMLSMKEPVIGGIKNLAVADLFFMKEREAKEKNIDFYLHCRSNLAGLAISAIDLTSILGNLIDNAFDAVESLTAGEQRLVQVELNEDEGHYIINVLNKHPIIPARYREKIFQQGFTTKGLNGSGLGLTIVRELTQRCGGTLQMVSNEEIGTLFSAVFPKTGDVK